MEMGTSRHVTTSVAGYNTLIETLFLVSMLVLFQSLHIPSVPFTANELSLPVLPIAL